MEPNKFEAVRTLVGGSLSYNAKTDSFTYHNGQTPPTKKQVADKLAELQAEWDDQEYARKRQAEYPSVGDQLDMLMKDMKNNTTTHQTACEAVKAKYPKPE